MVYTYNWFVEGMVEYTIGMIIFILRVYSRTKRVGFRGWRGDDYMTILAMIFYTVRCALFKPDYDGSKIHVVKGQKLPKEQMETLILSLKTLYAGWLMFVCVIWSLKACMLFFYAHIIDGLGRVKLVRTAGVLCAVTYVASMLVVAFHCIPPDMNWDIRKYPGHRPKVCATSIVNFAAVGLMNLLTDLLLLCIPLPVLWQVQKLSWGRRIVIAIFLCSGIFIIVASVCRNVYGIYASAFRHTAPQAEVLGWAVREMLVAIIVVNAPALKSLVSNSKWLKTATTSRSKYSSKQSVQNMVDGNHLVTWGSQGKRGASRSNTLEGSQWTTMTCKTIDIEKGGPIATHADLEAMVERSLEEQDGSRRSST